MLEFTLKLSRISPAEFAQTGARRRAARGLVVVGEDFTSARDAGERETLRALGEKYDFKVETSC